MLQLVTQDTNSYLNVVIGQDPHHALSKHDVFVIGQKKCFLFRALTYAQKNRNSWTWYQCCHPGGGRDASKSLVQILSNCSDFQLEENTLEHLGEQGES